MSPEDFELFNMQWESYRDTTLVPNLYTAEGISMELWQCCGNTLQGNLINNSMANTSSETELLSKLKTVVACGRRVGRTCRRLWPTGWSVAR